VPFDALMEFYDPSVQFGLKFENISESADAAPSGPAKPETKELPASVPALPKPRLADKRADPDRAKPRGSGSEPAEIRPRPRAVKTEAKEAAPAGGGDKIVSIDSFRKKT
jgi:hypothetical protein